MSSSVTTSNLAGNPKNRRDTLNPFEFTHEEEGEVNLEVEFKPEWYKERYLVNYES